MNLYQITKYNPKHRDVNGKYLQDEWTSIHDIGRVYNGAIFSDNEYIQVENAYINAIKIIIGQCKIDKMYIKNLEKYKEINDILDCIKRYPQFYPDKFISIFKTVTEGNAIKTDDVYAISRLILREDLWCELHSQDNIFEIHFGYDYYMKIVCNELNEKITKSIVDLGLFVEQIIY